MYRETLAKIIHRSIVWNVHSPGTSTSSHVQNMLSRKGNQCLSLFQSATMSPFKSCVYYGMILPWGLRQGLGKGHLASQNQPLDRLDGYFESA